MGGVCLGRECKARVTRLRVTLDDHRGNGGDGKIHQILLDSLGSSTQGICGLGQDRKTSCRWVVEPPIIFECIFDGFIFQFQRRICTVPVRSVWCETPRHAVLCLCAVYHTCCSMKWVSTRRAPYTRANRCGARTNSQQGKLVSGLFVEPEGMELLPVNQMHFAWTCVWRASFHDIDWLLLFASTRWFVN